MTKRHALFVGVDRYSDRSFKDLDHSVSDATALSAAFRRHGFDETTVLSNPESYELIDALEYAIATLGKNDVFLFFFAGHGYMDVEGRHLLVCSGDRLPQLRHGQDGVAVDSLMKVAATSGCNCVFLLDACKSDIFDGVDPNNCATGDLPAVSLPDAKAHSGAFCLVRSSARFRPSFEPCGMGRGVFAQAVLDVVDDDSTRDMPVDVSLASELGRRVRAILAANAIPCDEAPSFQLGGGPFLIFGEDGVGDASPAHDAEPPFVGCPICGKKNSPGDTFRCLGCGRDDICLRHQDGETFLCMDCAADGHGVERPSTGITLESNGTALFNERAGLLSVLRARMRDIAPKCNVPGEPQGIPDSDAGAIHPHAEASSMLCGVQLWEGGPYWAECNVGATKPEESGYYFWWGDTVGYAWSKIGWFTYGWVAANGSTRDFEFIGNNCPTYKKSISELRSLDYIDSSGNLAPSHDAATALLGGPWRMPTDTDWQTLIANCDTEWTTRNGVNGRLVKGRGAYSSKSIFLPAVGIGDGSGLYDLGSFGYYGSSTPGSGGSGYVWYLYFNSGGFVRSYYRRYYGHSVRPLRVFAK